MEIYKIPAIGIFFLLILIRPLTVFFHEMGHGITGWLITRKKILVFIGSYGNKEKSIKINIFDFIFYILKNPFKWGIGLCETEEKKISINNQILFVLGGPIASLLIAGISYLFFSKNNFLNLFFLLLIISSLIDFVTNIFPSKKTIYLSDGRLTSNDGKNLLKLIRIKKLPKEFTEGLEKFQDKKFDEAVIIFENVLNKSKDPTVYRMAIASNIQSKNYEKAKNISFEFRNIHTLNSDDLSNLGLTFSETGQLDEALKIYDESLKINPNNKYPLNNKGYTLILSEKFAESIPVFDKAISLDKNFSYSYNNRGLAKINLNMLEEGVKDIENSLKLDPENSDAYKNLGIYYLKMKEYEKSLEMLLKAKNIDESTSQINELIKEAKLKAG